MEPRARRPDPPLRPPGGKRLGYKIRTFASDPDRRDDQRTAVCVLVTDSNPDEEERIRERSELPINQTLTELLG